MVSSDRVSSWIAQDTQAFLYSAFSCFINQDFNSLFSLYRKVAIEAYDVDALAINMLALVFAVFFIPGSILAIALYARFGLNSCIIGAAFLNLMACLFRCSSCMTSVPHVAYTAVLVGHIMAAIGSPLVLNAPSRVANDWFPKNERALAVSIMTQANYIGGGLGGLLPALQVSGVADIFPMLLSQAAVAGVILLLSIIFTPSHSPVHPDFDALYQVELRSHVDVSSAASIYKQMFRLV
jgi:Major Facilitator Superfamily